jgi:plasmid rolling circle replication initiator protein Rep
MCSEVLEFGWSPDERAGPGVLKLKLKRTWFCKVPLCPVCMWRKSLTWLARIYDALPRLAEDYPSHRWIFLTLTVRNIPVTELREGLRDLHKAFDRLTKRAEWKRAVHGWVRSTEVTPGEDGPMRAHPHIHSLCFVPSGYFGPYYVKQARWRELWAACARLDYDPTVDVRRVTPKKRQGSPAGEVETNPDPFAGLRGAIAETAKYATKPSSLTVNDADWVKEFASQVRGVRMMSIGGCLSPYLRKEDPRQQELIVGDGDGDSSEKNPGGVRYGWREDGQACYTLRRG